MLQRRVLIIQARIQVRIHAWIHTWIHARMRAPRKLATKMTLAQLNEHFALPGILAFDENNGLARAQVTLPNCLATVYLHGAHLTNWHPAGQAPVLFVSSRSEFAQGKPIRGGIPVCFPWFATDTKGHDSGKPGPSHGFARLQEWEFAFAALVPGEHPTLHLTFTLAPSEMSRHFGCGDFRLAYEMIFGAGDANSQSVTLRLTVANPGKAPLEFEEALHTYFHVAEVTKSPITGLESAKFLDKTDAMREKTGPAGPLLVTSWTDRVYPANTATTHIADSGNARTITIAKTNSATTIVWNPWDKASAAMADLGPNDWPGFLCVETANTGAQAITLQPGGAHTMQVVLTTTLNAGAR
jgi:glucose-6-phosphate 1-epimerase